MKNLNVASWDRILRIVLGIVLISLGWSGVVSGTAGTVLVILGLTALDLVPDLASAEGELVDQMFMAQIYVIAFVFSLVIVLMLYSIVVFRRKRDDDSDGPHITGHVPLEIAWTVIPLLVVLGFGTWGASQLTEITASTPDEVVIEITGYPCSTR